MTDKSGISAYFHCRTCLQNDRIDQLAVGLIDATTLRLFCETCEQIVGDFRLQQEMPLPKCAICNEPLGPDHHHQGH